MSISGAEATVIAGLIGAGAGLLGGAIGSFGTWRATRRSVAEIEREGNRQRAADAIQRQADRDHQWELVFEERRQQNLLESYVDIQRHVSGWCIYAEWRIRGFETNPPTPAPALPQLSDRELAIASLLVSQPVERSVNAFTQQVTRLRVTIGAWEHWEQMGTTTTPQIIKQKGAAWTSMEARGNALLVAGEDTYAVMRTEIAEWRRRPADDARTSAPDQATSGVLDQQDETANRAERRRRWRRRGADT